MPKPEELTISVPEPFHVHDEATANWVVRRIVEARAYADRVQTWAALEQRRADREVEFFMRRFGAELENWARERIAALRGRRKMIRLPAGAVGFRTAPPHLSITDEPLVIRWCRTSLPNAIVTTEHVLKTLLRQHLQSTGECPNGVEVVAGGEKFYVR